MANGYVVRNHWPLLVDGVGVGKRDLRASFHLLILYIIELVILQKLKVFSNKFT